MIVFYQYFLQLACAPKCANRLLVLELCKVSQRTIREPHLRLLTIKAIETFCEGLTQTPYTAIWMKHLPRSRTCRVLACLQHHDQSIQARQDLAHGSSCDLICRSRNLCRYVPDLKRFRLFAVSLTDFYPPRSGKTTYLQVVKLRLARAPDRVVQAVLFRYYPDAFVCVVAVNVLPVARFSVLVSAAAVVAFWDSLCKVIRRYSDS